MQLVTQQLSLVMLLAIEVAVEFWLSLKFTPQAQLLSDLEAHTSLAKEVGILRKPRGCKAARTGQSAMALCIVCVVRGYASSLTLWPSPTDSRAFIIVQIKEQSTLVWSFIVDREVEAPARFRAIQTYRAATAIAQQQVIAASSRITCCHPIVPLLACSCRASAS